jgi:uncharacterized protein YidB (DUF937 family)
MSGLFGQIASGLMGNAGMMQGMPGLLSQILGTTEGATGGGLQALLGQLESAGLGEHVRSWIGSGPNQPITPEQLGQAIPQDQLASWAQQAGTTAEELLPALAHVLPHAVDHATPDGTLPAPGNPTPDFGSLLARLFSR